jgi:hypothetical protein
MLNESTNESLKNISKALEILRDAHFEKESLVLPEAIRLLEKTVDILSKET